MSEIALIAAGIVLGRALTHVLATVAWALWLRFAYTRGHDAFLRGPVFLGRYPEGVEYPFALGVLRRVMEGRR